ncbi:gremlin-2 [Octopus bimaculoides]|uniref:CTCK domain-containing protein n=1 Tax=Octopus bimaculoides TaxID=37653 RepID=A0A0L8HLI6_OCTBM|nr:gremlin-2 [Octopus bimaculoides]|eukprot:XP_014771385.1 PREDICTED: gremlin-2-like [Octopus bimaculoides]
MHACDLSVSIVLLLYVTLPCGGWDFPPHGRKIRIPLRVSNRSSVFYQRAKLPLREESSMIITPKLKKEDDSFNIGLPHHRRQESSGSRQDKLPIKGSKTAFTVTRKSYLRKEWCKTELLKQVIREEGCLRQTVLNRFCYGQCNSFFIPRSGKHDGGGAAFMACGYCKPRRYTWIRVTLRCQGAKHMRFKRRKVQRIKQCKCMAQKVDGLS